MKEVLRALSNDIEYAGELSELTAQEANEVNRLVTLCPFAHRRCGAYLTWICRVVGDQHL